MRLNIRAKLLLGFAVVLALTAVVGVVGYTRTRDMNNQLSTLYLKQTQSISYAKEADVDLIYIGRAASQAILEGDPTQIQAAITDIQQSDGKFRANMAQLDKLIATPDARDQYTRVMGEYEAYKKVADQEASLALVFKDDEATQGLTDMRAKADAADNDLTALATMQDQQAKQAYDASGVAFAQARDLIFGAMALAILLGIGLALFLSGSISRAVRLMVATAEQIADTDLASLSRVAGALAQGDLTQSSSVQTQTLSYRSSDEMGALAQAFNHMIEGLQEAGRSFSEMAGNLRDLVAEIADSAAQVSSAGQQLASAAEQAGSATGQVTSTIQQVAQGTANQASSTTAVTASMDDIARRVEEITRGAQDQAHSVSQAGQAVERLQGQVGEAAQAAEITAATAGEVAQAARAGEATVQSTIKGMEAINQSTAQLAQRVREMGQRSEEIGKIVGTIQDIADQTNLLALNAAIEAARAGEQGRGFAVVADEVRKLAEKAGSSSREIAQLVRAVQTGTEEAVRATDEGAANVARGVEGARGAGRALEEILSAAQQNSQSTANIQAATARVDELAAQVAGALQLVSSVGEKNLAATQVMMASIGDVGQAIESVAAVSEENSASVEEVSATAEELSAQVEEVSASAQQLSTLAEELQNAVGSFTLAGAGQAGAGAEPARQAAASRTPAEPAAAQAGPMPRAASPLSPAEAGPIALSGNGHHPRRGER
jgi:methyl-accepting chemotaxis protein